MAFLKHALRCLIMVMAIALSLSCKAAQSSPALRESIGLHSSFENLPGYKRFEAAAGKGDYWTASRELSELIGVYSNLPSIYFLRGQCFAGVGLYSNSIADFSRVIQ